VRAPGDERAVLAALGAPGFDPAGVALTSEARAAARYPGSAGCRIRWTRDDPDRLALEIEAPDRAFVVIADAFFPGWAATIDGRPLGIVRVNHLVRGVEVPAGRHAIEMRYEPEGWGPAEATTRAALAFELAA